jgi:hypothetical protein
MKKLVNMIYLKAGGNLWSANDEGFMFNPHGGLMRGYGTFIFFALLHTRRLSFLTITISVSCVWQSYL